MEKKNKKQNYNKGFYCPYCGQWKEDKVRTDDHIFAIGFIDHINMDLQNEIHIDACKKCNNEDKCRLETYVPIVLALSSNYILSDRQERAICNSQGKSSLSKEQRKNFLNEQYYSQWIKRNGILQYQSAVGINWADIEKLFHYIALGLIYYYTQIEVKKEYYCVSILAVPTYCELSVHIMYQIYEVIHPQRVIRDNGRYGDQISYTIVIGDKNIFVFIRIFDPIMLGNKQIPSRFVSLIFLKK